MPVELAPPIQTPVPPRSPAIFPPRKLWTRQECDSLESTGLWNRDRFELIDGELVTKMPKNRAHTVVLVALWKWLSGMFGADFTSPESPVDVAPEDNPSSQPEPDIAVLAKPGADYMTGPPPAADVRLLVEISDSTLQFDLGPKAALYSRAGILEYWVVDIRGRRIIVHRNPHAGAYLGIAAYHEGEAIWPLAMPTASLAVTEAFPFPADKIPPADL